MVPIFTLQNLRIVTMDALELSFGAVLRNLSRCNASSLLSAPMGVSSQAVLAYRISLCRTAAPVLVPRRPTSHPC